MAATDGKTANLKDVMDVLKAEIICGEGDPTHPIATVCASDLMSDVLAFSTSRSLLVTGLTNPQVVRTAEVTEIGIICFVFGKSPQEETVELAESCGITLLRTAASMYTACGKLYGLGIPGCIQNK